MYKLLIIDDSENDVLLMIRAINQEISDLEYHRVDSKVTLEATLKMEREWDLIITDNVLPQFSGAEAVDIIRGQGLTMPIICISGSDKGSNLELCLEKGATLFIMKDNLPKLATTVKDFLVNKEN